MIVSSRFPAACCLCALFWATELAAQAIPMRLPPVEPLPPGRVQPFERIPRPLPNAPSTLPARPSAGRPPSRPTFHPPIAPPPAFSTPVRSPPDAAPVNRPIGPAIVLCSPAPTAWFRAEYVQFYLANAPIGAPLVTASDVADQGRLGSPSASVLLGDHRQPLGGFSGIRLTGGSWFGGERRRGAEVSAFLLPGHARDFDVASAALGDRVLALPFTAVLPDTNLPDAVVLAQPGSTSGTVHARMATMLWGIEANALRKLAPPFAVTGDFALLAGMRFLQLRESFDIAGESAGVGSQIDRFADVRTQASFIGVQVGGRGERRWRRWSLQTTFKTAFGATSNLVTIAGQSGNFAFGSPQPAASGTDVLPNYLYDFSVVPEVQARLSFELRPGLRLSAGYDFLYWTRVLRPGNQLDTRVDETNPAATLAAPFASRPLDRHSDFWLHGWNLAIERVW